MIPGEIFTSFAEFQGIVSVNDFWFPSRVPGTFASFSVVLVKFCFCTDTTGSIEWPCPAPRLHTGDCFDTRNCRLGPCDLLLSSHQNVQHEVRLRHCVFCMGPCNFGPFTDLAISVFGEMSMNIVFTQILTSLFVVLKKLHEKNWRESLPVMEFHHPPKFP